jgi:hypothetical protein
VGVTDAGVEDSYNDVAGGSLDVPAIRCGDFGEAPKRAVEVFWVVGGSGGRVSEIIGFGKIDEAAGLI